MTIQLIKLPKKSIEQQTVQLIVGDKSVDIDISGNAISSVWYGMVLVVEALNKLQQ